MKQRLNFEPKWMTVTLFFAAGIFMGCFGLFVWLFSGGSFYGLQKLHLPKSSYKFINPLLAVDPGQTGFLQNYALQKEIQKIIDQRNKNGSLSEAGIYFRDIESGRWLGINENITFSPGKLLKIPIMITYLKEAEVDPTILKKLLLYKVTPTNPPTPVNDQIDFVDGKRYPILDILQDMIVNDDADATNVLYDNVDKDVLDEVYSDLGAGQEVSKQTDDYISIKTYSLFFRVLYNATYLNREHSELALNWLSQTGTNSGLTAGLPRNTVFSHKFGTRVLPNRGVENHECGIVYYTEHPYIICAMAVSSSPNNNLSFLRDVSEAVYQDTEDRYKSN